MIFSRFKWNKETVLELEDAQSAYLYFRTTRINLLTGFPEVYPLEKFMNELAMIELQGRVELPRVFHFYYELGLVLAGLGHSVNDDLPLAMDIVYEKKKFKKKPSSKLKTIPLKTLERPNWTEYKDAFNHIQEHLLAGNAYQVNLTYPFDFELDDIMDPRDLCDYFFSRDGLSAYAHATYFNDDMILSNSPECLFQYRKNELFTMPIKGTRSVGKNWQSEWKKILSSVKEEGELNMITDLLRNDLNRLERPRAQVLKKRAPLLVPGLLHQYSLVSIKLNNPVSLLKTLESVFPGGSVTGAPKKRVMEIIQETERFQRGIYCGSTLLCLGDKKVASINIRTASISISDKLWRYGAGGGITLLSKAPSEYQEMESKVSSFLTLLNVPGY